MVRIGRLGALLLVVALTAGCGLTHLDELNFRVDHRLHFLSPKDRSKTHPPITLRWRIRDFRLAAPGSEPPSGHAGYFAVFVDQAPIKAGQTMKAVAHDDRFCQRDPRCPDRDYLIQHQVYTTNVTSITIDQVARRSNNKEKVQLHTFIVVLMDTSGHRIGESAWELDLRLPKAT